MTQIEQYLHQEGIHINPRLLNLAEKKMSQVIRTRSLEPQGMNERSNLTTHVVSMLRRNADAKNEHHKLFKIFDSQLVVAMIAQHDLAEISFDDVDYAATSGNSKEARDAKEYAEHKYLIEQVVPHLPRPYRDLSVSAADKWLSLDSPEALWVKLLDFIDGNCDVYQNFMNRNNGSIRRITENGTAVVWPVEEAGRHIGKMVIKTATIMDQLLTHLGPSASKELFDYFNESMMAIYEQTGWIGLRAIQELAQETGYGS